MYEKLIKFNFRSFKMLKFVPNSFFFKKSFVNYYNMTKAGKITQSILAKDQPRTMQYD